MAFNIDLPYELEQYVNPNPVTVIGGVSIITGVKPDGTNGRIMNIEAGSGFGFDSFPDSLPWVMRVDHSIDYEISFWFRQAEITPSFELSVDTFDCNLNTTQPIEIVNGTPENRFIFDTEQVIPYHSNNADIWRFARYILYNKDRTPEPSLQPKTSLGVGRNLIMDPNETTANLLVNLFCTYDQIQVWNFKVKPLSTPFSTGFVQSTNLLEVWRKNNNKKKTETDIDNIANRLLFPYNVSGVSIKL